MIFYYGNRGLSILESPEARGESKKDSSTSPFDGYKSLTFYAEKLPRAMSGLTGGRYDHYRKNKASTCYEVDLADIPDDVCFRVRWSDRVTDLYMLGQDRVAALTDAVLNESHLREIYELETKLGLRGHGKEKLIEQLKLLRSDNRSINQAVINLAKYNKLYPELGLMDRPNTLIPHVLIYFQNKEAIPYGHSHTVYFK